jgi:hypothetical protein
MPTSAEIVAIARLFRFVREASPNAGQRVEAIQRWCGGLRGQSWCAYYATMVLDLAFAGESPIPRLGACQDIHLLAQSKGWITETPATGDLFLYVNDKGHAHHAGIVTGVALTVVTGIAGNTSRDGKSSNGDGVYERPVPLANVFIAYPRG